MMDRLGLLSCLFGSYDTYVELECGIDVAGDSANICDDGPSLRFFSSSSTTVTGTLMLEMVRIKSEERAL